MYRKYLTPEYLFLITGILIAVFRFLHVSSRFDFTVHNTYIILDSSYVTVALLILFAFFSLPYTLFRKANNPLSRVGGWMHYSLTMLPFLLVFIAMPSPERYQPQSDNSELFDKGNIYQFIEFILILFAIGQFVFFVNLSVGLVRLIKKRNSLDEENTGDL